MTYLLSPNSKRLREPWHAAQCHYRQWRKTTQRLPTLVFFGAPEGQQQPATTLELESTLCPEAPPPNLSSLSLFLFSPVSCAVTTPIKYIHHVKS